MRSLLVAMIQRITKWVLWRYKPVIIGITGSVGKTSAKEAIVAVLSSKFSVRASPKNYNNELGLPLSVIGGKAAGKSLLGWCGIFLRGVWLVMLPHRYPKLLVLEMGADRPKDILKLVQLAPPTFGVVTAVSSAHTEFFGSVKRIAVEKRRLVEAVPKDGIVVLNVDDPIVRTFNEYTDARVITYGIEQEADVRAIEINEYLEPEGRGELGGVQFKILHAGSVVPMHVPNVLGVSHVHAALAAAAIGVGFNMHLVEIATALNRYVPPPGRMRLIKGVKDTLLIDDTYNSSPRALHAALTTLGHLPFKGSAKRYAVLGDMLELGAAMEEEHRLMGRRAAECSDVLIAVGVNAAWAADEAKKSGMSLDRVFHFNTVQDGLEQFLQDRIVPGDVLLCKGSQGIRMEKIVKGLMAEPLAAKELLCRQGKEWEKK